MWIGFQDVNVTGFECGIETTLVNWEKLQQFAVNSTETHETQNISKSMQTQPFKH